MNLTTRSSYESQPGPNDVVFESFVNVLPVCVR